MGETSPAATPSMASSSSRRPRPVSPGRSPPGPGRAALARAGRDRRTAARSRPSRGEYGRPSRRHRRPALRGTPGRGRIREPGSRPPPRRPLRAGQPAAGPRDLATQQQQDAQPERAARGSVAVAGADHRHGVPAPRPANSRRLGRPDGRPRRVAGGPPRPASSAAASRARARAQARRSNAPRRELDPARHARIVVPRGQGRGRDLRGGGDPPGHRRLAVGGLVLVDDALAGRLVERLRRGALQLGGLLGIARLDGLAEAGGRRCGRTSGPTCCAAGASRSS